MLLLLVVFALILRATGQSHGPVFLLEPPAHLTFSNTTGSQVSCSAHGSPSPQVDWLLHDGQTVTAVPGLRQSLGNGTLYFPPFRSEDYRKDVHTTVYRCRAANIAGTIISRDVNVRAVVNQHYDVQVYHTHVSAGNTAVLVCVIPAFVKEHVSVTSWSRDESILLPGSNMGGRLIVTYGTGELHIRSARAEDGLARYSCLTLHALTQERKRSAAAILTVTEATRNMAPRLSSTVQTVITAERDTDVHLTCSAQGNPPPIFNWYREFEGHLQPVHSPPRYEPIQDIVHIRRLKPEDSGRWTCKVSNSFGEQKLDIHLTVTAHLSVHILPQLQVINSGANAIFNCSVSGAPLGQVSWLRNGKPIAEDDVRIKMLSTLVLSISGVTRHDRGMYQCIVKNERESAQGSAELRLGDTVPELQYTFIEQAMRPGVQVSLRCAATGSPPPKFRWFLDGEPISDLTSTHRFAISQYVDHGGDVISHLNFTSVRVEDGGLYSCHALNSLGSSEHSARLNIYGPPFVRSIGPVRAVAGADVTLHCPYSGYPIAGVRWERHGQELPLDLRHRLVEGSLIITRVDPVIDSGFYACYVTSRDGEIARREIQLVVDSPPILEPFKFPASLQEGGRAQVTCSVTSGDMPIHFAWFKDGEHIPASLQVEERAAEFYSLLIFKEISSRHSGSYTCVASNSAARANYTAQLMVKVSPQWLVEPQDISILVGSSVLLGCSAKGFPEPQITWLRGQGKSASEFQPLVNLHNRASLMVNGSLWIEVVSPQDEGYYLCRAANGIGAGISKVIFLGVNEPARFDSSSKNVSVKRGNPANLLCRVYGDIPIDVAWTLNGKRIDTKYRYVVSTINTDNGVKSQITIARTDREDSGTYRCLAENTYGRSEYVINVAIQERPDPPSMLEIIEVSSRSVRLAWRRSFNGNSPLIGYMVQYQILTPNQDWDQSVALNLTLPVTSHIESDSNVQETAVIGGLTPATVYTLRLMAINNIDQSAFTEAVIVKTQEEEPSEAPKDVRLNSVGPGELLVTWSIPTRESWNGELLGYIVSWSEHGASGNQSKTITVKGWATTKVQLTGLRKFTRYDVSIKAFNSVSTGPSSPIVVGTTKEGVPEGPPQEITCSQGSSQSMKISWIPPPKHLHGGLIQGYKVYYRPLPKEEVDVPTIGEVKRTSSSETYLHGLYKYTNYSIKVLAYTGAGDGKMSEPLYCSTEEDLPGAPSGIKAAALTGESILVAWLPPSKPNGKISHYTVYAREAGRVGKHTSYNVRVDHAPYALHYEVRNLQEHQLYEFWVSATTTIGEGEPTAIVAQTTNSRAPSRIVTFSQELRIPVKNSILMPCLAVGNPTPRTRWIYRDRPITFSPFYTITNEGHLQIPSADQSLAGNYTCSAKNLFGDDNITYSLTVLLQPGSPRFEVQFATTRSIRLHWAQPEDGGAMIQGYTLNTKRDTDDWTSIELSPENTVYTLDNLHCGTLYHIYLMAHNRVGNGSPSPIISSATKGGPPQLPKEKDFIATNSTTIQLNLNNWPDGGCPITLFGIQYKAMVTREWNLISDSLLEDKILLENLTPATWYQLKIRAENDAGKMTGLFSCATTTLSGGKIAMPPPVDDESLTNPLESRAAYIIAPSVALLILFICGSVFWHMKRHNLKHRDNQTDEVAEEKSTENENRRNSKQVYTSSPIKSAEKINDNASSMYEISPYATFNVHGNNSRSVTASTLDYTMQFKTFGHIEDDEHNAIIYPKNPNSKLVWYKHRFYDNEAELQKARLRTSRPQTRADSESDETSGSPCGDCPTGPNYRIPVKSQRDLFRPDSSTESNDVSPLTERRPTPRLVAVPRRYRPSSSSSEENLCEEITLDPPLVFSGSRELSEAECDRDTKNAAKLPNELAILLERYQERKEQERKEFTIHV